MSEIGSGEVDDGHKGDAEFFNNLAEQFGPDGPPKFPEQTLDRSDDQRQVEQAQRVQEARAAVHRVDVDRDAAMAYGSADLHQKAADRRADGSQSMGETYDKEARRSEEAHGLAYDMIRKPGVAYVVNAGGRLQNPDQDDPTVKVMARVGLLHIKNAEQADAQGNHDAAAKLRIQANAKMGEAAYREDFGVDASKMIKTRWWQFWR
jgi:hypothetical protein